MKRHAPKRTWLGWQYPICAALWGVLLGVGIGYHNVWDIVIGALLSALWTWLSINDARNQRLLGYADGMTDAVLRRVDPPSLVDRSDGVDE